MRKERYFIITTLIVGIITALPTDKIVFEIDSSKISSKTHEDISHFASNLPSKDTCGKRKAPSFRIAGGIESDLGVWPWMVALGYESKNDVNGSVRWMCSGSLISKQHVLTAGHCEGTRGSIILKIARLGDLNLDSTIDDGLTPLDVPIERFIKHKEFNSTILTNDIGLVVLKNDITFTTFIQPICLPLSPIMKDDIGNNLPFVSGWGTTEFRGKPNSSLKQIQIPVIDMEYCKWLYESRRVVIDYRNICAGETGKDSCQGDSGSPLMWLKEKQFYLIGISSYGLGCGDNPGLYTNVSSYMDWILENI
ncbi:venom protease-like isoform X1 [Rhopalosiphum padi]|uniref:venom protease-like isoform X1 n=1 Tax=Rhopalosiphum padi TaxID=40932 RepID=UPI00298E6015|nr:venom protease-like isoform X1 [Rhopalosiphum padi]XP_060849921.1 venom protease-like isoform X1 [Rhopalosiphum padi]XP_060849922.1 venom protease-like isoform X1 [Rhopalosiphum padi]